jgi:hypothetical protein
VARRDAREGIDALLIGRRRLLHAARVDERDGRADDDAARLVLDEAAQRARRLLRRRTVRLLRDRRDRRGLRRGERAQEREREDDR